ncbi:MAG: DUF1565 domain-containing protein [Gemmataceae bacterium]
MQSFLPYRWPLSFIVCWASWTVFPLMAQDKPLSHPPLRAAPAPSQRPLAEGPRVFVDAQKGDDTSDGSQDKPWRTLKHALEQAEPGATIHLRGGTYYEQVRISRQARADAPLTIRSYPGEQAILDGGFREFFEEPATAWHPIQGSHGEYRSARAYPNLRTVLGLFGDSMIGLNTYYHAQDMRATNELWDLQDEANPKTSDVKPVWCGPGLWYNPCDGRIHIRLAHTHLPASPNYRGETDPRRIPLVIAPFHACPLTFDGASHIQIQDLVIRGGGYDTIICRQASNIVFDNVTIWCGTYGMRLIGTRQFKLLHSGLYGSVPPWTFRGDTSLRSYPGRPFRDITRLGTHALLVGDAGREFSVYYLPRNDDWEIAYCEFCDAHDGPYLGGVNLRFHHNWVHTLQDDGIYLSPMYEPSSYLKTEIHVYQNLFSGCLTTLAFGGSEETKDVIYIYRNIFDLRAPIPTSRPSSRNPQGGYSSGKIIGDHGSPPWPTMYIYHNTVIASAARFGDMSLLGSATSERPRRLFNNIIVHLDRLPALRVPSVEAAHFDGNLYGAPNVDEKQAAAFFQRFRATPAYAESKKVYPPGCTTHSRVADPRFSQLTADATVKNDYRLTKNSPAVNAGVPLPADWPDPLRDQDQGQPDIGALPLGAALFPVGRAAGTRE